MFDDKAILKERVRLIEASSNLNADRLIFEMREYRANPFSGFADEVSIFIGLMENLQGSS